MPVIGEVLYVKSTEEPVLFHSARKRAWYDIFLPETTGIYRVRRPLVNPHGGVTYKISTFLAEELETESEQANRLFTKFKQRQALSMSDEGPAGGPLSFKTN